MDIKVSLNELTKKISASNPKFIILVYDDFSCNLLSEPKDYSELGFMGFAFRKDGSCLTWRRDGDEYHLEEEDINRIGVDSNFYLHNSVKKILNFSQLKEVLEDG